LVISVSVWCWFGGGNYTCGWFLVSIASFETLLVDGIGSILRVVVEFQVEVEMENVQKIIRDYEERVRNTAAVPQFSHGRGLLGSDGSPSVLFIGFLFSDHSMGIEFLKISAYFGERCNVRPVVET
jgi:hypothetical protein